MITLPKIVHQDFKDWYEENIFANTTATVGNQFRPCFPVTIRGANGKVNLMFIEVSGHDANLKMGCLFDKRREIRFTLPLAPL